VSGDDWNDATKYILWDGMKFDRMKFDQLKDCHKDKDTHNNQPKTRGDNGGCKRGGTIIRDVKGRRLVMI